MPRGQKNISPTFETPPTQKPNLPDLVRAELRVNHYSITTEIAYVGWIKRFILYHNKQHPNEMGKEETQNFINHLDRSGLRLSEILSVTLKDIDFDYKQIVVRDSKGEKDGHTILPDSVIPELKKHLNKGLLKKQLRKQGLQNQKVHIHSGTVLQLTY